MIDNTRISYQDFQYWAQQRKRNQQRDVKRGDMIKATGLGNALFKKKAVFRTDVSGTRLLSSRLEK